MMWRAGCTSSLVSAAVRTCLRQPVFIIQVSGQPGATEVIELTPESGKEFDETIYLRTLNIMEAINKEKVASVTLITSRTSEDEVALYEAALGYALESLSDDEIERRFGASRDEVEGAREDLRLTLTELREAVVEPQPVG